MNRRPKPANNLTPIHGSTLMYQYGAVDRPFWRITMKKERVSTTQIVPIGANILVRDMIEGDQWHVNPGQITDFRHLDDIGMPYKDQFEVYMYLDMPFHAAGVAIREVATALMTNATAVLGDFSAKIAAKREEINENEPF